MLALVGERHPNQHGKVMSSLRSAGQLAHALPVEWLPVEVDVEVMDVVARTLAPGEVDLLVETRQRLEMGSALFKTFVATTGKLFGFTPATIIRHLGKGWRQVLSDCGVVEIERAEPGGAVVWIRDLPAVCATSLAWTGALRPGMRMLYELVDTKGDVEVSMHERDAELRFTW